MRRGQEILYEKSVNLAEIQMGKKISYYRRIFFL